MTTHSWDQEAELQCFSALPLDQSQNPIEIVSVHRPIKLLKLNNNRARTPHKNLIQIKTTSETIQETQTFKCGLLNIRSLAKKALLVNEIVSHYNIDLLSLTETWLHPDEYVSLNESTPPQSYQFTGS